jgi:hypothetical protein
MCCHKFTRAVAGVCCGVRLKPDHECILHPDILVPCSTRSLTHFETCSLSRRYASFLLTDQLPSSLATAPSKPDPSSVKETNGKLHSPHHSDTAAGKPGLTAQNGLEQASLHQQPYSSEPAQGLSIHGSQGSPNRLDSIPDNDASRLQVASHVPCNGRVNSNTHHVSPCGDNGGGGLPGDMNSGKFTSTAVSSSGSESSDGKSSSEGMQRQTSCYTAFQEDNTEMQYW